MAKKTKSAAQAAPTMRVALLDASGVLTGFDDIAQGSVANDANGMPEWVEVPDDCDLKAGRYAWDAGAGRFDPIKSAKVDAETAIIDMFKAVGDLPNFQIPETTARWIAEYDKRKARAGV